MMVDGENLVVSLPYALAEAPTPTPADTDDGDGAIPAELRAWLVRLRLLDGVPFAYLVADTDLLPAESIRWFYVDRRWTDALVQGALAVGTVNSDDRTQLAAAYPAVRDELDREERNVRRRAGSARSTGQAGPISGFLLRSRLVSGWPALHVRAYSAEPLADDTDPIPDPAPPSQLRLLRLERLAPAVLLCLFDGIPTVVHLEEPRQGVQFGFDTGSGDDGTATLEPRNVATFARLEGAAGAPISVPFRPGATGVVDIGGLEQLLAKRLDTGAARDEDGAPSGEGLDSSEFALQLIRRPYRQVFGPATTTPMTLVFQPTVSYETLLTESLRVGTRPAPVPAPRRRSIFRLGER